MLRNLRPLVKAYKLKGANKTTVESAITNDENNQEHMRDDEYLAAGYPIASGVAEGAVQAPGEGPHGVRRMRWELEGAQAILSLRAVIYLNDLWISSSPTVLRQNSRAHMAKMHSMLRLHKAACELLP